MASHQDIGHITQCPECAQLDADATCPRCKVTPANIFTAMVDAAMVEMANITPPLKRSECKRLIQAALDMSPVVAPFGYVNTYTGQFFRDVEACRKGDEGHWRTVYTHHAVEHGFVSLANIGSIEYARELQALRKKVATYEARDALGLVPGPTGELSPVDKEWAKTEAGYAHVDAMLPRADGQGIGPYWYGWALRGAFVAGAEWQETRTRPAPDTTYAPLTITETRDLTCILAGAPWPDEMLPELQRLLSIYDGLRAHGQRPVDPATLPREAAKVVMETGLLPDTAQPLLLHPDDAAVDRFAAAMKAKLASARAKGRSGWEDKAQCQQESLALDLRKHVHKGDPVDVANFAMMLHQRGESTKLRPLSQDLVDAIKNAPPGASVIEHNGHPVFITRASNDAAPMLGLMESNHCELQAKAIGIGRAKGEILLKVEDGGMVPQDLEVGMAVDVLYTPSIGEGTAG